MKVEQTNLVGSSSGGNADSGGGDDDADVAVFSRCSCNYQAASAAAP